MDILVSFGVGFSALVDALPCDVWVRDSDERLVFGNPTMLARWKAKLGMRPEDHDISAATLAIWQSNNRRAFSGELVVDEVEYSPERFFNVVCPVWIDGRIVGTAGVNVAVHDLQTFEDRLNPNRVLLGLVMDAMPVGLAIRRIEDGDIVHCLDNRYACRLFGRSHEEMVGRRASELGVARQTIDRVLELYAEASRLGRPVNTELEFVDHRGTRLLEGALAPIVPPPGAGPGAYFVLVGRDITDAIAPRERQVDASQLASIETLVSAWTHEISNPLTYVMSNVALAEDALESEGPAGIGSARESLHAALEGLGQISDLIRDLRALARGEKGAMGTVDLVEVTQSVVALVGREASSRAKLELKLEAVPKVRGSPIRLAQVLLNLIKNALAAFPEDRSASENHLTLQTRVEADEAVLEVRDNGLGVDPELADRLFERGTTSKMKDGGSGLGLYVCRTLIRAMRGSIKHRTPESGGASFVVRLPIAAVPERSEPSPTSAA